MWRKFYTDLANWEDTSCKEPLLVIGARQVGKTWLIREFCEKTYGDYVYLNLETDEEIISLFEGTINPREIIQKLEIYLGKRISIENTAIFLDEIQKSERVINSLKYFCEAEENYRVIGAGSLLGVKLSRFESSFPVGKVRIRYMYPMDFEEYLLACGEELLLEAIKTSFGSMVALPDAIHSKANDLYQKYLYVGGMPAAVLNFVNNEKNIMAFDRSIHQNLLLAYAADMTKYTLSAAEGVKIHEVYQSIPRQLARKNPKFKYKEVRANANRRDFQTSLDWLTASGLVLKSTNVNLPQSPLSVYQETGNFKIYLSDVGLLSTMAGVKFKDLLPETGNIFKGAIAENYVIQTMTAAAVPSYYYKPDQSMEIDQLLDLEGDIVPLEIKSGRHKRSTSLKNYSARHNPIRMYRLSERNFGMADNLYSVPLYAAGCLFFTL